MNSRKSVFFAFLALLSPLAQATEAARTPDRAVDDVPLDFIIPKKVRDQIDHRKSEALRRREHETGHSAEMLAPDLSAFTGNPTIDLRERDTPVKKQFSADGFGTCSAFGLVAAMENALGGKIELSERHLWSQYRSPHSSLALKAATTQRGVIEESGWPQDQPTGNPDEEDLDHYKLFSHQSLGDNIPAILAALNRGAPIYFALNTPVEMSDLKKYIRSTVGSTQGGHAIAVVGYQLDEDAPGGGYLIIKNSWGLKKNGVAVGDHGYQWLNFQYCAKKGNYCRAWSMDRVEKNPGRKYLSGSPH